MNKKIAQKVPNLGVQKNLKDVYPVKHKKKRRVTSDVYKQVRKNIIFHCIKNSIAILYN